MKERKAKPQFVICIRNEGCEDIELRKIYQVLLDKCATQNGYIRMVDESGEDYLYPAERFVSITLPKISRRCFVVYCYLISYN